MRSVRCRLKAPSATKKPITVAAASDAAASSSAISAPLQYGPEESADQKRCQSKLASTSREPYFTSPTGILYFAAIVLSAPVTLRRAIPSLIWAPSVAESALR